MNLMSRIPRDFYRLFASRYAEYYMKFLVSIYEEMSLSYSVLGLTERECCAVMNEKIASAELIWDGDDCDEDGIFLTRSNMASVCLRHFEEWGWLKRDYDETLNSYVVLFPEYSQMYVELFRRLFSENESEERESVMTVYSHLYTYSADKEKNNEILKSALRVSKRLVQMLVNMQDGMREYFDELSRQKDFRGIQEVLVKEINNSDSRKYAILTTTDSFYRYKEAVKELIDDILSENEKRRYGALETLEKTERGTLLHVRAERTVQACGEAADVMMLLERQFDAIERRYNKLIEQKTVFAGRAAARIRYVLREGAEEDQTVAFIDLLNRSGKKEEILEKLSQKICMSRNHAVLNGESMYRPKNITKEAFRPQAVSGKEQDVPMESFVLHPLYTRKELDDFRKNNTVNGVFRTGKDTIKTVEDLEKLFFVWQDATENASDNKEITVGNERWTQDGLKFSDLEIKEE